MKPTSIFVNILLPLAVITLFISCEKSIEWEQTENIAPQLVVEAILTDEEIHQEIKLSQSFNELNDSILWVNDATVMVETNGTIYNFISDNSGLGIYKSENPFQVKDNLTYNLLVEWQGKNYSSSSQLSTVVPMPNITFASYGNTDSLILGNFVPIFDFNQQSLYEIEIDWSHLTNELPTQAKLFLYTFNDVHISEFIPPQKENIFFPKGSFVHIKKYGLNDDYAEYLRAKAIETDWNGAVFFATAQNLPTNINNNALGFFSTCAVLSETVVAE